MAKYLRFVWEHQDDHPDLVTFRLYEDGVLAVDSIGAMNFDLLMEDKEYGVYNYHVTAVRFGLESAPSETVTANFTPPSAPTGLSASLVTY
jgi:hypothetical protein